MSRFRYRKLYTRILNRPFMVIIFISTFTYLIYAFATTVEPQLSVISTTIVTQYKKISINVSADEFILNYKPSFVLGARPDATRFQPTIERIRNLLEIIRSKEDKYQPLLETFDVFSMLHPQTTFKAYTDDSNIEEIKKIYNRYIKLLPNLKQFHIEESFIDYLKTISTYLSDGLRNRRTNKFQKESFGKPTFVLACNSFFFDGLQLAIKTLDTYWPSHQIAFYDLGLTDRQEQQLRTKCTRCTVIKFPFSSIEKFAPHIRVLKSYAFKPFVIQDALRRYGTIIYGDSSARFNKNSFDPVLVDNYIRGFAVRELPNHFLSCYTRTGAFSWFNQSHSSFDDIYMAEANFLVVTDTFLSRLIMKTWLICAMEEKCLIAADTPTLCSRSSANAHRFDQSAMVIILTHFFYQGNKSSWGVNHVNDPAPYDMFTSVQTHLGDIRRGENTAL